MRAAQMREDYGTEPISECYMQYYYSILCPTSSWYWIHDNTRWAAWGVFYTIGDPSMARSGSGCPPYEACDPYNAHTVDRIRVLDFAAYGTTYPGLSAVEFEIWCADPLGCPVGSALWSSGPVEFCQRGWNYLSVEPPLCVTDCSIGNPPGYPRFLVTCTEIGQLDDYPAWGFDNISSPVKRGCQMHEVGCCPALYPRPFVSHYSTIHTGYYRYRHPGGGFEYCPPLWLLDGKDTVGNVYGYIELAWRVYLSDTGPTSLKPSTWGSIK